MTVVYGADATGSNYSHLPKGLLYAGYTTGSMGIAWSLAQFAAHPDAIRICQDPGATDLTADVLDVESGAATLLGCAPWARAALANYRKAVRPGQRSPAIYTSQSNVTNVVNALIAGGVTSGIGLWVADWGMSRDQATAKLASSGGPFPVIGYQYEDAGLYDLDVWLSSWVNNVSKKGVTVDVPPGQWNDPATWTWKEVSLIGVGLDGQLHVFNFDPVNGTWGKAELWRRLQDRSLSIALGTGMVILLLCIMPEKSKDVTLGCANVTAGMKRLSLQTISLRLLVL